MSVVDLGNQHLLMVYSLRNVEQPGIMAVLSEDEGKNWKLTDQVMIWDAHEQTNVGMANRDRCLADMATYAFGKPQVIKTTEGSILVSFWCTQACVTHIRWSRLTVE